jgi:ribose transport system substrate-binding protein
VKLEIREEQMMSNINIRKVLAFTVVVLLLMGFVAGCSKPAVDDEPITIGMVVKWTAVPYNQAFIEAAKVKAEELGMEVIIQDSQGDAMRATEIMDTYIARGVDGILYGGSFDETLIIPGIKRVNEAGIPITALDASPEGGKVDFFISSSIEESSKKATEYFIKGIKERNNGEVPKGVVILVMGRANEMFGAACNRGFFSVIDQYPQLTVASGEGHWNNEDAHTVVSDQLQRHGDDVLGIYVHTPDIMGLGAVSAIEAAGKDPKDFGLCGYAIGPEGMYLLREGKFYAIVNQTAYDAASQAMELLYKLIKGLDVPQIGDVLDEEGAIWGPAEVLKNPWADEGAWIRHQSPVVPFDISLDDERLWENKLDYLWK